jgi:hypothetical protein
VRRAILLSLLALGLASVGVAACGPIRAYAAANRSTSQFIVGRDPRVLHEAGAEELARAVEEAMPAAVARVEAAMGGPFHVPVRVYVCASIESFASYGASPRAGGLTTNHRIFISPKPENTVDRAPHLLAHELTHLHMAQEHALLATHRVPAWFEEGLAVDVSGGGGAEGVEEAEAWRAIASGHVFVPDLDEVPLHGRGAHDNGLDTHMFYRQGALYLGFLRALAPARFEALLVQLEAGGTLEESFTTLGVTPEVAWSRFLAAARSRAE